MKRFVHVGFSFTGKPPLDAIQQAFDKADDWMRYDSHCWILYTGLSSETWRNRLHKIPGLDEDASFLLVEFDKYVGYQQEWVWDWLQKDRSE